MRSSLVLISTAMLIAALPAVAGAAQGAGQPLRFVDAHSHLLPNMTVDEEMAMFKKAGVTAVVIMSLPPDQQELVKLYPGYLIPFVSFARSRTSKLLPLNADTIATFGKMLDSGAACGFGEIGTMMDPSEAPAASLLNPLYLTVYELADAHRVPLTYHIDLDTPEVIEAFGRVAEMYPHMPLILAHAGFNAAPEVSAALLAAHPNIYVDLSIRLDPLNGLGSPPATGPETPNKRTMLDANGALTPEWRKVLERYPDRFMFAMDIAPTGPKGREQRAVELTEIARKAFSVLPRETREAIAHRNMERLLRSCPAGPK
jgi:predicted TIM-barrel fold metal-dependent hydrolase